MALLSENPDAFRERYLAIWREMVVARTFEEKVAALYRAGKIVGGVYLGRGQEAFSASLGGLLDQERGDVFGPLIRDQAGRTAFGEPLIEAARTYLGSVEGPMRGRDGNIHRGRPGRGQPAMISHLGAMVPVVNGMLFARRAKDPNTTAVGGISIGDGGTSTGAFHEGLNQAAVENLPLVVAIADNQFAYSTPTDRQYACENLVQRAVGYGVHGELIDGTDLAQCLDAFDGAIARARAGEGPQIVVGKLLRLAGHGEHDDASYIPPDLRDKPHGGDCLPLASAYLVEQGWMTEAERAAATAEIFSEVDEVVGRAQSESAPQSQYESWQCLATKSLIEGHG